jgi:hypothetical protein
LKFTAVRRSLFGHRELSISLWDGDKPGKTFWPVFKGQRASSGLLLLRARQKLAECTAFGRPLQVERSTQPTRSVRCEPCQTAAGWRGGLKTPSKVKSPPARQRRTSRPTACRVHRIRAASASRGTKRATRPTRPIRCEPCQTAAGWKGGLQTPSKGISPRARQRGPSWPTTTCRVHHIRAASARSV